MTLEEIREALQAHGMCTTASLISGYSKTCVSDFKRTGRGSDALVSALAYAVPLAQKELTKRKFESVYTGGACLRHGLTTRYVSSNQCVECAKFFARGRK